MTLIELSIVVIVLGILMSIAVAAVFRAKMSANEGAAVAALRTINTAQFQYQSSCGAGLYAQSLLVLGTKPAGESQSFLTGDLGGAISPTRSGYVFSLGPGMTGVPSSDDCNGVATVSGYYASAAPETGDSGRRAFATSHVGTLWENLSATPPTEPFGPPARLAQ